MTKIVLETTLSFFNTDMMNNGINPTDHMLFVIIELRKKFPGDSILTVSAKNGNVMFTIVFDSTDKFARGTFMSLHGEHLHVNMEDNGKGKSKAFLRFLATGSTVPLEDFIMANNTNTNTPATAAGAAEKLAADKAASEFAADQGGYLASLMARIKASEEATAGILPAMKVDSAEKMAQAEMFVKQTLSEMMEEFKKVNSTFETNSKVAEAASLKSSEYATTAQKAVEEVLKARDVALAASQATDAKMAALESKLTKEQERQLALWNQRSTPRTDDSYKKDEEFFDTTAGKVVMYGGGALVVAGIGLAAYKLLTD